MPANEIFGIIVLCVLVVLLIVVKFLSELDMTTPKYDEITKIVFGCVHAIFLIMVFIASFFVGMSYSFIKYFYLAPRRVL